MDKKGLNEIRTQLRKARRMYETAQINEMKLFDMLEKENIDLDTVAEFAPNADNLGDAISCYLCYNESNEKDIMAAIAEATGE